MDQHGKLERKPYEKPELMRVPLRPEEAVLGACKTASSAGPTSLTDCTLCSTAGS
jgi:hypothetical protein